MATTASEKGHDAPLSTCGGARRSAHRAGCPWRGPARRRATSSSVAASLNYQSETGRAGGSSFENCLWRRAQESGRTGPPRNPPARLRGASRRARRLASWPTMLFTGSPTIEQREHRNDTAIMTAMDCSRTRDDEIHMLTVLFSLPTKWGGGPKAGGVMLATRLMNPAAPARAPPHRITMGRHMNCSLDRRYWKLGASLAKLRDRHLVAPRRRR